MSADQTATHNVVNLDDSDVNGNIKRGELVQQTCYDKLTREIKLDLHKEIERNPEPDEKIPKNGYPMGSGFVYFVDGTRGAGKTTFLKTVYESTAEVQSSTLQKLAYIDPSRIEQSENILLFVLKELKLRVDDQLHGLSTRQAETDYAEFRKSFKAIAGGLSLFQNGHDQLKDLDADLFLDWGLERAGDSTGLRNNLHQLIKTTCRVLNAKALLLAFDDADTNASFAMRVLECIRKYLDTPQLVILVTGDMELYSQQVRDHFYESMGKHLTAMDGERREQRTKMVDHLEDQYLLKLFPIRRRIQLGPIWNLIEAPGSGKKQALQLSWKQGNATNLRTFKSAIDELLRRGLRLKNKNDRAFYSTYLLKQPIRSVLQVLSRCSTNLSRTDGEGDLSQEWSQDLSDRLSEGLRSMALGSLYKFGVDVDAIGAQEMPALVDAVFELVVRDGDFDTGAYLRPQSRDIALKSSFASLASEVSRFCVNDPSNALLYMLGGPGSVALWGQVQKTKNKEIEGDEGKSEKLRTQFKNYIGTGRNEDALNWAWHASTILTAPYAAAPSRSLVYFGVIGLNKGKVKGQSASSAINSCAKAGLFPAFAFSLVAASGVGTSTFASIFNILGLIGRLLNLKPNTNENLEDGVRNILANVYQTPTITRPGWQGVEVSTVDEDFEPKEDLQDINSEKLGGMAFKISRWLKSTEKTRKKIKPSAVLFGKIWTRLYFSLDKVSAENGKALGAASLMELFAFCVVNAFLVEELEHHLLEKNFDQSFTVGNIDKSNPVNDTGVVAKKFSQEIVSGHYLPITFLIASCPLIVGLMRELKNPYKSDTRIDIYAPMMNRLGMYGGTEDTDLCDEISWNYIEASLIAGPKAPEPKPRKARRTKAVVAREKAEKDSIAGEP